MGEVVLAAKVTHVPSLLLSEREGALKGRRAAAIEVAQGGWPACPRQARRYVPDFRYALAVEFRFSRQRQRAPRGQLHQPRSAAHDPGFELRLSWKPYTRRHDCRRSGGRRSRGPCAPGEEPRARIRQHRSDALHECGWRREGIAGRFAAFRQTSRRTANSAKPAAVRSYGRTPMLRFWRVARFRTR